MRLGGRLLLASILAASLLSACNNTVEKGKDEESPIFPDSDDAMTSLAGLSSLAGLGEGLTVCENDALPNLSGLSNLSSVGGDLYIGDNDSQTDISGVSSMTVVDGDQEISDNDSLCQSLVDAFAAALGTGLAGDAGDAGDIWGTAYC
jgi:hypothetical protein